MAKKATTTVTNARRGKGLTVTFEPRGPQQQVIDSIAQAVQQHASVQRFLKGTRNRLLSVDLLEPGLEDKGARRPAEPSQFMATLYDYTNNRVIRATGDIAKPKVLQVGEFGDQPVPTSAEFDEAVAKLREHPELGGHLREKSLLPYLAMPPLVATELPDGRIQRTVAVGLLPASPLHQVPHEIVGVNLVHHEVIRFPNRAPATSAAHNPICGPPGAGGATTGRVFVPGQAWVTIKQGNTVLWKFLAVRPAATKGAGLSTNGTGVELRFVDYRGKRVLYRAHVPMLNVKYDADACGPYRDWQNEEGVLQANGVDPVPGFRLCNAPATTILDTGSDGGNFLGVAVYVQGKEVVLVSQMHAGWYRYVSEWRFDVDGTIRPRFGFSAIANSCVCNVHHHHAYWRLDFDIRTPGNNQVREFNDPCLPGFCPSNWHDKMFEIKRPRDPARKRKWRVENTVTHEAYDIIPGPNDGVATAQPDWPYPQGDVWILRYHGNEIDDGSVAIGPPFEVGLNPWVNGESIANQDVVIWYGAHFTHDVQGEPPGVHGHIVGPDLKLVKW